MGLQEVARRVLLGHWVVILVCVVVASAAAGALQIGTSSTYTASTRLVLDAPTPQSLTEATALADTAKAIVTAPSHVIAATKAAGLVRDPLVVIRNITMDHVGTSGVLQLSVTDSDPAAAAALANALADDLITTRLAVSPVSQQASLDSRIKAANDQIALLDQQIAALDDQLASLQVNPVDSQTAAVRAQILADRISAYNSERSSFAQEELQLEAERNSLTSSPSVPTPAVIDRAVAPTHADPSRLPVELALALVIGLIVGIAISAVLETFGPTLASGEAIAEALGVPLLGWLPDPAGTVPDLLKLAARAAEVKVVELIGAGDTPNLSALARSLAGPGDAEDREFNVFAAEDVPAPVRKDRPAAPAGLVLVSSERIRKAALGPVKNRVAISGRPLLGVIVYTLTNRVNRVSPRTFRPAPRLEVVESDVDGELLGMSKEVLSDLGGSR
jgi:capsular polysaccharide biosynthesis protein